MIPLFLATILTFGSQQHGIATAKAPFDAAALTWVGDAHVRIRAGVGTGALAGPAVGEAPAATRWITPAIDGDIAERHATAITHFAATKTLEYAFDGPVANVTVTLFDASVAPAFRPAAGGLKPAATQGIVTRVEWGCPDGESAPMWPPVHTTVTHAVVHHTAGSNDLTDWATEVLNIWYFHTFTNGWGDIGYNFLIDPNGVVYEGRAGGDGAIGAHFSCRNTNTAGIALLGTFTSVAPTKAALTSLESLLADLCRRNSIDPAALVFHVPSQLMLPTILGHRDGNPSAFTCTRTECPGDVLYSTLPMIRTDVAAILSAPPALRRRAVHP